MVRHATPTLVNAPAMTLAAALLGGLALLVHAPVAAGQDAGIRWESYTTMGADERPIEGRLGRLTVPEDHDDPDGASIEIAFVVLPSDNPDPGPPTVFLAGGPGGSGVEGCLGPATGRMVRLLAYGDVIGIDQRGTGLSRPDLSDEPDWSVTLPPDEVLTREAVIEAHHEGLRRRREHWAAQGVDLSTYTTAQSARDVEAVCAALGHDQVMLWGASYGTHLALALLRAHPERVARAALFRIEGPDHTVKLPAQLQEQLERVAQLAGEQPAVTAQLPDLLVSVKRLLHDLRREPVVVEAEDEHGERVAVTVGAYDLQRALADLLARRDGLARMPWFVHTLEQGDWGLLGSLALEHRIVGRLSTMTLAMDCASGASPHRRRRLAAQLDDPDNLLADAMDGFHLEMCAPCADLDVGEAFRAPLTCDVPVLLVSGDLDARTPVENAVEVAEGLPRATQVVVRHAGHASYEFMLPDFRELLAAFLRGDTVQDATVSLPPLDFMPFGGG